MTKFFEEHEQKLLAQPSIMWQQLKTCPKDKGLYMICHIDYPRVCYIGESKNMYDRLYNHHRTGNHSSFRRNLEKLNKKVSELKLSQFLEECSVKCLPMEYGRKELEEYLIEKYRPKYNAEGVK